MLTLWCILGIVRVMLWLEGAEVVGGRGADRGGFVRWRGEITG